MNDDLFRIFGEGTCTFHDKTDGTTMAYIYKDDRFLEMFFKELRD